MGRGRKIGSDGTAMEVAQDATAERTIPAQQDSSRQSGVTQSRIEVAEPAPEPVSDPSPTAPSSPAPQSVPSSLRDASFLPEDVRKKLLKDQLSTILCAPKVKGSLPTLVRFHDGDSVGLRTVIIDIGAPVLNDAWQYYKANADRPTANEFLQYVYDLTKIRIPRLYRMVAELKLD